MKNELSRYGEGFFDPFLDLFAPANFQENNKYAKGLQMKTDIKENDKVFYCGGIVLRKIVEGWLKGFNGDIDTANAELAKMGGVRVK